MTGQHSNIAAGLETHWYEADWASRTGRNGEPFDVWLRRLSDFFEMEIDDVTALADESGDVVSFLSAFMDAYARRQKKHRWLEKTCGNILHIDRIFEGWPGARFVQITRDPRDVFASLRRTNKYDTVDSFARLWCEFAAASEAYKTGSTFDPQAFLDIRYENLVRNPAGIMKTILAFVQEPWEDDVARFVGQDDDYNKILTITGKESSTLQRLREPLSKGRIGVWNGVVTPDDVDKVRGLVERAGLDLAFDRAMDADADSPQTSIS